MKVKEEDIRFRKVNARYELSPEERILFVLKNVKTINPTKLSRITNVGYLQLQNILQKLKNDKIISIDTEVFTMEENVNKSIKIKYLGK